MLPPACGKEDKMVLLLLCGWCFAPEGGSHRAHTALVVVLMVAASGECMHLTSSGLQQEVDRRLWCAAVALMMLILRFTLTVDVYCVRVCVHACVCTLAVSLHVSL